MCHRSQTFSESSVARVSLPDDPSMRASDAERERVVEALRRHATAGRLSVAELEERSASAYDARTLAETDAGGELPNELARLLAEHAGGNPYFIGEAIRDLRERGALQRENGRLAIVGKASVPAAIQEALQARLDRLDPEARELITTAAVVSAAKPFTGSLRASPIIRFQTMAP